MEKKEIVDEIKNGSSVLIKNKVVLIVIAVLFVLLFVLGIGIGSCSSKGAKPKASKTVATSNQSEDNNEDDTKKEAEDAARQKEMDDAAKSVSAGYYSIVTGQKVEKKAASTPIPNSLDEFRYKVCDAKTGLYVQYTGNSNNIVFPAEIEGIPVVEVSVRNSAGEKNIVIPEGVEAIANMGRVAIINIDIPTTVKVIRNYAFAGCKISGDIAIKSTCKLGDGLFAEALIENVVWPFGTVPAEAFAGSPNLSSVIMNDSTKYIGESAFANCRSLAFVQLPKTLTSMGKRAFRGDAKLAVVKGIESCGKFEEDGSRETANSGNTSNTATSAMVAGGRQFEGCVYLDIVSSNKLRDIGYKDPFEWHTSK